jgi:hypothetical protein
VLLHVEGPELIEGAEILVAHGPQAWPRDAILSSGH